MRRGRPWRGAEEGEPCPRRLRRFLEPCLLLLLHEQDGHGYELAEAIKPFGFDERHPVDASLVYRTLRWLERNGMVVSSWDTWRPGWPTCKRRRGCSPLSLRSTTCTWLRGGASTIERTPGSLQPGDLVQSAFLRSVEFAQQGRRRKLPFATNCDGLDRRQL
jgi:hypothetical protein